MSRLRRLPPIPFAWYRITLHAVNGRRLVTDDEDLGMFLDLLRETLQEKGAHLHAGCITPTEVHLAVQCGESPVSSITRSVCHEYARRFNRRHFESGRLFRGRPDLLLIQHRLWLVRLAHVIHWIPRRRQLQSGAEAKYWSSDGAYRGRVRLEGLITHVVLHIVSEGARLPDAQRDAYRKCFDSPPDDEQIRLLSDGSPDDPRMLGDAEFLADIWRATGHAPPWQNRASTPAGDVRQVVVDAVEEFRALCDLALPRPKARAWVRVVTLEQLCSHSRRRPLPVIRALITTHVIARGIATRSQAARFFGCRPDTLSVDRRRHAEAQFAKWFGSASISG
jgi:putative transposase